MAKVNEGRAQLGKRAVFAGGPCTNSRNARGAIMGDVFGLVFIEDMAK